MAEYPMDLGTRLPRIHQELIHVSRHDARDPGYAERLARTLEQRNAHLWDDLNLEATRLAAGSPAKREDIMRFGMHVVDLFDRAIAVDSLEHMVDLPEPAVIAETPKRRFRTWFAGQAAVMGFFLSASRKRAKDDGAFLG